MSIEAMKLALEALSKTTKEMLACRDELAERGARPKTNKHHQKLWDSAFNAYSFALNTAEKLRPAIEQAEKAEPVAWQDTAKHSELVAAEDWGNIDPQWHFMYRPLYTAPPQREWVGLTDDDLTFWGHELGWGELGMGVLRAVDAHLKEKNT